MATWEDIIHLINSQEEVINTQKRVISNLKKIVANDEKMIGILKDYIAKQEELIKCYTNG